MRRKFYTVLRDSAKSITIVPSHAQMVALQPNGERPPFFIVDSYPYFIDVVRLTGIDQPVLSLIGYEETQSESYNIRDEAEAHVKTILAHQPHGPYMLGGCSASGIVAYEIAQQLRALRHEVGLLVLFDTANPYFMREYSNFWMSVNSYRTDLSKLGWSEIPGWVTGKFRGVKEGKPGWLPWTWKAANRTPSLTDQYGPSSPRVRAARRYRPAPYSGRFLLVKREGDLVGRYRDPHFGWGDAVQGEIELCKVGAADHLEIFKPEPDRQRVAQTLRRSIDAVIGASSNGWSPGALRTTKSDSDERAMSENGEISAVTPDWNRERCQAFWDPGRRLLRSIRSYQKWKKRALPVRWLSKVCVLRHRFWSVVTGADIPLNCDIGGGLMLMHPNGVVVFPGSVIGPNCLIFQQVTIGTGGPRSGAPILGGNVTVGAGAKILGGVKIGDHALIGANAVVLQDVPEGTTAVGVPATILHTSDHSELTAQPRRVVG